MKIPWRRKWQPTSALLPGKSHGQRSLAGYSPWGRKESDTTERLHFSFQVSIVALLLSTEISVKINKHWYFTPLVGVSITTSNYGSWRPIPAKGSHQRTLEPVGSPWSLFGSLQRDTLVPVTTLSPSWALQPPSLRPLVLFLQFPVRVPGGTAVERELCHGPRSQGDR